MTGPINWNLQLSWGEIEVAILITRLYDKYQNEMHIPESNGNKHFFLSVWGCKTTRDINQRSIGIASGVYQ
jgi:hypothetical protein